MKSKDIKVGEEYAFIAYRSHRFASAEPVRVKVLATGVTIKSTGWARGDSHGNIRVSYPDGNRGKPVVRPVQIEELWSEWLPKREARDAARVRAVVLKANANAAKWAGIAKVDAVLAELGVEGTAVYVSPAEGEAAADAGFDLGDRGLHVTLHGVDDKGRVSLSAADLLVDVIALHRGDLS